jgi:type II secretory pathway pseudopilin PulG
VKRAVRQGAVLLEAMIALTILSIAIASLMALVAESGDAVKRADDQDREMRRASAFVDVVALWSRTDLDRHLGMRQQGPWWLSIDRETPTVYTVALFDSTRRRQLITTAFYKAEPTHATR